MCSHSQSNVFGTLFTEQNITRIMQINIICALCVGLFFYVGFSSSPHFTNILAIKLGVTIAVTFFFGGLANIASIRFIFGKAITEKFDY